MPISDAQYQAWLGRDGERRVLLVEAQAYSGGSVVTRYLASAPFVSGPAATPANIAYDDIVRGVPQYRSIMSDVFSGQTRPSWGEMDIDNSGGVRDSWLNDAWDGRPLQLYLGSPDWARDDFRLILSGVTDDIVARSRDVLQLKIRDKQQLLNVPVSTALIGGSSANAGKPEPACWGECYNVRAVLIDAATRRYKVHGGAVSAITTVYCGGVSVAFTAYLASGEFTLTSAANGEVTADIKGDSSGGYVDTVGAIVQRIVTSRTSVTASDIDSASFTAFAALCPQKVGIYAGDRQNVLALLDDLVGSVGAWYGFGRDGKLRIGRLDAPSGSPVLDLTADDIEQGGLSVKRRILPCATIRVGYRRNWAPTSSPATSITDAARAALAADYLIASATDASVKTAYLLAREPDREPTLLVSSSDAAAEATRRLNLRKVLRYVFEARCFTAPQRLELGQVVRLTHPRFDFAAGRLAVIVGIVESPTSNRINLELWA